MSGGHWGYRDQNLDSVTPEQLKILLNALPSIFHDADWVASNDSLPNNAALLILDKVIQLGDKLFGE